MGSSAGQLHLDIAGAISNSGVLYAGRAAQLQLDGSLTNHNDDILAETDLTITGRSTARATAVHNRSGCIEAIAGHLTVGADTIDNERTALSVDNTVSTQTSVSGNTTTTVTTTRETVSANSAPSQLLAGGDSHLNATTVNNRYSEIAANGDLTVQAETVTNAGRDLIETVQTTALNPALGTLLRNAHLRCVHQPPYPHRFQFEHHLGYLRRGVRHPSGGWHAEGGGGGVFEQRGGARRCRANGYAVVAAVLAGRPLLVQGEPGVGKSQLARAAAYLLERPFVATVIQPDSEYQALLWSFDYTRRLAEAQIAGHAGKADAVANAANYIGPGALWWGLNWRSARERSVICPHNFMPPDDIKDAVAKRAGVVVLVDEIDKADINLANGLLEVLGNGQFAVPPLGETVRSDDQPPPLVVLTSNETRQLPAALVRRCVVFDMVLPDDLKAYLVARGQTLVALGQTHFPRMARSVLEQAAQQIRHDREQCGDQGKTGVAEYLDLLTALHGISSNAKELLHWLEQLRRYFFQKWYAASMSATVGRGDLLRVLHGATNAGAAYGAAPLGFDCLEYDAPEQQRAQRSGSASGISDESPATDDRLVFRALRPLSYWVVTGATPLAPAPDSASSTKLDGAGGGRMIGGWPR